MRISSVVRFVRPGNNESTNAKFNRQRHVKSTFPRLNPHFLSVRFSRRQALPVAAAQIEIRLTMIRVTLRRRR